MTLVSLPPKLGRHSFCMCTDENSKNTWQSWTNFDLEEALREPEFFSPMAEVSIEPGDMIELFQVAFEDLETPEADPIAMASVTIGSIATARDGKHVNYRRNGSALSFNGNAGKGASGAEWNLKYWSYVDGVRDQSFRTKIELGERVDELKKELSVC